MPKKKVVIASLLKPVDDVRSFRKIGLTLSLNNEIHLTLIGPSAHSKAPLPANVRFLELSRMNRLSVQRLFRPWLLTRKILQLQPDVLIITSHELLFGSLLAKLWKGTKIVYDIQENYFRNLWYQNNYPRPLRWILAMYIRFKEYCSSPFIEVFLLAEKCYSKELRFVRKRSVVLENKALVGRERLRQKNNASDKFNILFTGTISENSGMKEIQTLIAAVNQTPIAEKIRFTLVGQYHSPKTKARLDALGIHKNIDLVVSKTPIAYEVICSHIAKADFGILCYHINPSNENRIPTKVFEYLASSLPIIYQKEAAWASVIDDNNGGIAIDFHEPNPKKLYALMCGFHESDNQTGIAPFLWTSEQDKLTKSIDQLFS